MNNSACHLNKFTCDSGSICGPELHIAALRLLGPNKDGGTLAAPLSLRALKYFYQTRRFSLIQRTQQFCVGSVTRLQSERSFSGKMFQWLYSNFYSEAVTPGVSRRANS